MVEASLYTFISVLLVSLISFVGIFALSLNEYLLRKYIFLLISLAIGALLGDAFIHLIPESFEELGTAYAGLMVIVGILLFFILEKWLHWHHTHGLKDMAHEDECERMEGKESAGGEIRPVGHMILVSDGVHNFLDGVIIGTSYFISIEVGIATTLAVMLHEIPQEIGDFGVLLHAGFTKARALFLNFLTALTAILGASIVLLLQEMTESIVPWLIPFAAGGFIYIASSDLIPELHKTKRVKDSIFQLIAIAIGITAMVLLLSLEA